MNSGDSLELYPCHVIGVGFYFYVQMKTGVQRVKKVMVLKQSQLQELQSYLFAAMLYALEPCLVRRYMNKVGCPKQNTKKVRTKCSRSVLAPEGIITSFMIYVTYLYSLNNCCPGKFCKKSCESSRDHVRYPQKKVKIRVMTLYDASRKNGKKSTENKNKFPPPPKSNVEVRVMLFNDISTRKKNFNFPRRHQTFLCVPLT